LSESDPDLLPFTEAAFRSPPQAGSTEPAAQASVPTHWGRRGVRPRTRSRVLFVSRIRKFVALGCVVVALGFAISTSSPEAAVGSVCHARVSRSVIPVWARAGFSGAHPRVPYVLGRSGRLVAILFAYPLRSPVAPYRNNKILWVSRTPAATPTALWIRSQRMAGSQPVGAPVEHVVRGGPGPSYVDVPQPGCWRLTLSWAGRTDSLDLTYSVGT
jgi:hypothetical protein